MKEFFRGWKRKAGVCTLMLACILSMEWIRSYRFHDSIIIQDAGFIVTSFKGGFDWSFDCSYEVPGPVVEWLTTDVAKEVTPESCDSGEIPYWSIVIPLAAVSAFLLLKKPKTSIQKKPALPISDEGGGATS